MCIAGVAGRIGENNERLEEVDQKGGLGPFEQHTAYREIQGS